MKCRSGFVGRQEYILHVRVVGRRTSMQDGINRDPTILLNFSFRESNVYTRMHCAPSTLGSRRRSTRRFEIALLPAKMFLSRCWFGIALLPAEMFHSLVLPSRNATAFLSSMREFICARSQLPAPLLPPYVSFLLNCSHSSTTCCPFGHSDHLYPSLCLG